MTSGLLLEREGRASAGAAEPFAESLLGECLPALHGHRSFIGQGRRVARDGAGRSVCELAVAPRLLQVRMLDHAADAATALRAMGDEEWLAIFRGAARRILEGLDGPGGEDTSVLAAVAERASRTSGLPVTRLLRAWRSLAGNLAEIEEVLRSQAPGGRLDAFRTGASGATWRWLPAGRNAAIRIPGNFPTINVTWLQVLAARRPVVLAAPPEDPFTPLLLARALVAAGLPDGALSLIHGDGAVLWQKADQVIWPGDLPPELLARGAVVRSYHQGRSKVVLAPGSRPRELWPRLARMVVQGCGRLCTNASSLVVIGERDAAKRAGLELGVALAEFPALPLSHPNAIVPAFPLRERGEDVASRIRGAVARGASDLTESAGLGPLEVEHGGTLQLRPTVLLVEAEDPLFGAELPFPFVTVTWASAAEVPRLSRGSLIVGVIGEAPELVPGLLLEPSIDKLFSGDSFDHGYHPDEPHEGYLADFLFHKKTVLLDGVDAPAPGEAT
ncbi:MAG: aldehyde dehydrogenase family protein [Acidobacteria bacterium]|nr:aldehyde dehydrogenase family protein [Acidobacteriota bacterium]